MTAFTAPAANIIARIGLTEAKFLDAIGGRSMSSDLTEKIGTDKVLDFLVEAFTRHTQVIHDLHNATGDPTASDLESESITALHRLVEDKDKQHDRAMSKMARLEEEVDRLQELVEQLASANSDLASREIELEAQLTLLTAAPAKVEAKVEAVVPEPKAKPKRELPAKVVQWRQEGFTVSILGLDDLSLDYRKKAVAKAQEFCNNVEAAAVKKDRKTAALVKTNTVVLLAGSTKVGVYRDKDWRTALDRARAAIHRVGLWVDADIEATRVLRLPADKQAEEMAKYPVMWPDARSLVESGAVSTAIRDRYMSVKASFAPATDAALTE